MKITSLQSLPRVKHRESKYSIYGIIDLASRKDKEDNSCAESGELVEIILCLANEIKKLQEASCCKTCANYKKRVRRSPYNLSEINK